MLIKPNVAFDRSPNLGATTHPAELEALIHHLCDIRVADNPIESPADCFLKSGIRASAERAGGRVYLLAAATEVKEAKIPPTHQAPHGCETVLVAEDEEGVRELICDLLVTHGYHVLAASDGKEAVERFRANQDEVDLVILDVVMPGLKGDEVHDFIFQIRPEVPVMFSTGYSDEVVNTEYLERHGIPLIQKPYSPYHLLKSIRDILDQRN